MEWVYGVLQWDAASGWAQFIAAMVALWIAVAVKGPIWHSKHEESEEAHAQLNALLGIAKSAFRQVQNMDGQEIGIDHFNLLLADYVPLKKLRHTSHMILQISLDEFADYRFAAPALRFASAMESLAEQMEAAFSDINNYDAVRKTRTELIRGLISTANSAIEELHHVSTFYQPMGLWKRLLSLLDTCDIAMPLPNLTPREARELDLGHQVAGVEGQDLGVDHGSGVHPPRKP